MNMITAQQETTLEDMGFVSTDASFLYAGIDDVIKGNVHELVVETMSGDFVQCETETEFFEELLSRVG